MIADLQPYPAMRDSGVPWLGDVPVHWEVRRLCHIGCFHRGTGGNKEDETTTGVPCVRYGDLYTTHRYFVRKTRSRVSGEQSSSYTPIYYGDVLFAASGETIDEIGKSAACLIQSPAVCGGDVIVFRPVCELDAGFMGYATDCRSAATQKALMCRGTTVKHIYAPQLKRMALGLPPILEQAAIVRFLDHADRRIRRYIRTKQKLIKLLEEQKQAIIHRAVTRGLDPNVHLKPSGVEWLGDVPEQWEIKRGKLVFGCVDIRSETGAEELLTVSSSDGVVPRAGRNITMFKAASYAGHKLCWPQDLVINSLWAWAGGLGFSRYHGIVSTAYGVYRLRSPYNSLWSYLDNLLRSGAYDWQFTVRSKGIWKSRLQLTDSAFLDMPLVLPPADEADRIVRHIEEHTASPAWAVLSAKREIDLLREYRTRLIADVVTGKLDVRGIDLPDLADGDELNELEGLEGALEPDEMDKEENDAE